MLICSITFLIHSIIFCCHFDEQYYFSTIRKTLSLFWSKSQSFWNGHTFLCFKYSNLEVAPPKKNISQLCYVSWITDFTKIRHLCSLERRTLNCVVDSNIRIFFWKSVSKDILNIWVFLLWYTAKLPGVLQFKFWQSL